MKKILFALSAVAVMASCSNNNPRTAAETQIKPVDTAGLAAFQQWKVQNELAEQQTLATTTQPVQEKIVYVDRPVTRKTSTTRSTSRSSSNNSGVYNSTSQNTAKKKGWSKAAKGTAIGAGSGAVVGAIISKKKGKGAIIGGVIGAGVGYGVGRAKDKKDGRY